MAVPMRTPQLFILAFVSLVSFLVVSSPAQTNPLVNEGSGPIVGAGHNYIYGVSETVIPSNGSISLKINLPTPKGRGIQFPFALTYNSGAAHRFVSPTPGGGGIDDATVGTFYTDRAHQGVGWSDTLPYATAAAFSMQLRAGTSPVDGNGGSQNYRCGVISSYNFFDMQGSSHPLGLAALSKAQPGDTGTAFDPNNLCNSAVLHSGSYGFQSSATGGDDEVTSLAEADCNGYPTENFDCDLGPSFTVKDLDGTTYMFPAGQVIMNDLSGHYTFNNFLYPSSIKDRNGNSIQLSAQGVRTGSYGLPVIDAVGRQAVSVTNSGAPISGGYPNYGVDYNSTSPNTKQPLTYTVGGLNYTVAFTTVSASYSSDSKQIVTPGYGCSANFSVAMSGTPVVQSITAPNGTSYQFEYDSTYGLISEIDYPSGGWVRYQWKLSDSLSEAATFSGTTQGGNPPSAGVCTFEYRTPVVSQRTVGYSAGGKAVQTQNYSYNTTWNSVGQWLTKTTTVVTTDNVTGQQSKTIYSYGSIAQPIQVNEPGSGSQLPVETQVQSYDLGTDHTNTLVETVTKTWADQYEMTSKTTQVAGAPAATEVYCYEGNSTLLQEKDEYGFGIAGPTLTTMAPASPFVAVYPACGSPTPTRKTTYDYFVTSSPCQVIVSDNQGNRVSETDAFLDGATVPCATTGYHGGTSTQAVTGLIAGTHDEVNYGPSVPAQRGNPTKIIRWSNTGTSVTTTAAFDETGQIVSSTDGCGNTPCSDMSVQGGHTTTYSYADNFSGTGAPGATNAYVTSITRPSPNGVPLTAKYSYRYADGQVASATDANNQTTYYTYADSLNRLTSVQEPLNNGQAPITTYAYNDSLSPNITTTEPPNSSGATKTTVAVMDGMGHVVQTQLTSDPSGTDFVDTVYNGMGQIYSTSNPYRSSPSNTDGKTSFTYDVLGRKLTQTDSDGSAASWCYNGLSGTAACAPNASSATAVSWVDALDESQHHSQHANDAFGRLVAVMEPAPLTGTLALETDYTYTALNDLLAVTQKGGPGETARSRGFIYDSLSRLQTSSNPETGSISYIYDANGNLSSKTSPAPNSPPKAMQTVTTSYGYDAINRLTSKTYDASAVGARTPSSCFAYDGAANGAGRLLFEWTQIGPCAVSTASLTGSSTLTQRTITGYDAMGRVVGEQQCAGGICSPTALSYAYDLAGHQISSMDAAGATFGSGYDGAGRLTSYTRNQDTWDAPLSLFGNASYSPAGLSSATLGNGLLESYGYTNRMQLAAYAVAPSMQSLPSYGYSITNPNTGGSGYAPNGTLQFATDLVNGSWTYGYDGMNRLTSAVSAQAALSWTYDSFGNLWSQSAAPGTMGGNASVHSISQTFNNSSNQPDGSSFDAAGNQLSSSNQVLGLGTVNLWDAESRLVSPDNGATVYSYNAEGQRVARLTAAKTTVYIYDVAGRAINELSGTPLPVAPVGYIYCAQQGGTCNFSGAANVAYGNSGAYAFLSANTAQACIPGNFPNAPTTGLNGCFYQPSSGGTPVGPAGYIYCATSGANCSFIGNAQVAYSVVGAPFGYLTGTYTNGIPCTAGGLGLNVTVTACFYSLSNGGLPAGPPGFIFCATQNGTCSFSQYSQIAYGANGTFRYVPSAAGSIPCVDGAFGDPTPGVLKNCFYSPTNGGQATGPIGSILCATEGNTCYFSGTGIVSYGYSGQFYSSTQANGVACTDALGDPNPGQIKNCFYTPASASIPVGPSGYIYCGPDGGTCAYAGWAQVAYGANGSFRYYPALGGLGCQAATFGVAQNLSNSCFYSANNGQVPVGPDGYLYCAPEGGTCSFAGIATIVYGYNGRFTSAATFTGGVTCNDNLGDPYGGQIKACFYAPAVTTPRSEIYADGRHLATLDNGQMYYHHSDWLGTERATSDSTGAICQTTYSQPFGDAQQTNGSCSPSSHFFTGKERDTESGLDYFGARYYGSNMGRFMSPDPAGVRAIKLANPQTWNWYAYVQNNPLRYTDPTGMYTCKDDANRCATNKDKAFEASRQRDLLSQDKGVAAAAAAYGDPTKDNHVAVQYTDSDKGQTELSVSYDGKSASYGITVSIPGAATGTNLDGLVGHEGTHVEQDAALGGSLKPNGSFNKSLNLTTYDAENQAYHTQATISQQSGQPQTFGGLTISPGDTPSQINSTINQFLADPANGYGVTSQNPGPPVMTMKKDK